MVCSNNILIAGNIKSPHLKKYINYICDNGVCVDIICIENDGFSHKNCKVIVLGKGYKFIFNYIKFCFVSWLKQYDIVNPHFISSYGLLCLFIKYKKLVLNFWGSDILIVPKKSIIKRVLIKFLLSKCEYSVTSTQQSIKEILNLNDKVKVVKAGFGIDLKLYNYRHRNIEGKPIKFLINRWHNNIYNPMIILEALNMCAKKGYKFYLCIVGSGDLTEYMQNYVIKHNMSDKVKFFGKVDFNKMIEQYDNNDVYINMSSSDTEAISIKEAMASGLKVISSNIPAMQEFMHQSDLVNISSKELFEKLCLLFDNKDIDNSLYYRDFVYQNCGEEKNLGTMLYNIEVLKNDTIT